MRTDILIHQLREIIAGAQQPESHDIRTDPETVIRIAALIVGASIVRPCFQIFQGALQQIALIIDPVAVLIVLTVTDLYTAGVTVCLPAQIGKGQMPQRDPADAETYHHQERQYGHEHFLHLPHYLRISVKI